MPRIKKPQNNFAAALRKARLARNLAQEAFAITSSRTYVSTLERGIKSPTLNKVDDLADVLDLHPLSILAISYIDDPTSAAIDELTERVSSEIKALLHKT